jgi:hypothetical protein
MSALSAISAVKTLRPGMETRGDFC